MIKYVTLVCVLAAVCGAQKAPLVSSGSDATIVRQDSNVDVDGYQFAFETSDGISRQESGKVENPESENAALNVVGQYSYTAPDGKLYTVTFTAGPNGFQPKTSLGQKK